MAQLSLFFIHSKFIHQSAAAVVTVNVYARAQIDTNGAVTDANPNFCTYIRMLLGVVSTRKYDRTPLLGASNSVVFEAIVGDRMLFESKRNSISSRAPPLKSSGNTKPENQF